MALTFKDIKDTTAKQYQCYVLIFEKERNENMCRERKK